MDMLQLLRLLVARYDDEERPVTPSAIADSVDTDEKTVRTCLVELESNHLVVPVEDGYRPTVTARELLELDVEDGSLLIIDTAPDE